MRALATTNRAARSSGGRGSLAPIALTLHAILGAASASTVEDASPITLDFDFPSFLTRSDPVFAWSTGAGSASSSGQPSEWVDSLFGGNGDHGFQLWSPLPGVLQLDVSKQTLWDDRTPDLG
jgi:hypothetical protein